MKKIEILEIVVTGRGGFPIDMLRYDNCVPATEEDSRTIANSLDDLQDQGQVRYVRVKKIPINKKPWTIKRWESFGWRAT